jgi:hypothetical protein
MPKCFSTFFTKRREKLNSINAKVSSLIHNRRTNQESKYYKIGSSSQPIDPLTKYWTDLFILRSIHDEHECDRAIAFKAFHMHPLLSDCLCILLSDTNSARHGYAGKTVHRGTSGWQFYFHGHILPCLLFMEWVEVSTTTPFSLTAFSHYCNEA